jgi:hypothetical protein
LIRVSGHDKFARFRHGNVRKRSHVEAQIEGTLTGKLEVKALRRVVRDLDPYGYFAVGKYNVLIEIANGYIYTALRRVQPGNDEHEKNTGRQDTFLQGWSLLHHLDLRYFS